ncbi:MAG: riboflavin synthase, partial [Candidatus Dadabacteria bacterium]
MFSGIVVEAGEIKELVLDREPGILSVSSKKVSQGAEIGDSICVNGVCLTVVKNQGGILTFELAKETIRRTNLSDLKIGDKVNLEDSLELGEKVSGHLVFGHIDCCVRLLDKGSAKNSERLFWEYPEKYRGMIVEKGSIALNGISLTVGEVSKEGFAVYIIPHTAAITNISLMKIGDRANLEIDMLARYVKELVGVYQE